MVQPIGPLMIEHRLIERMIAVMKKEVEKILDENKVDVIFIDKAVDFIKTYADRCHHGKEEDILFRDLEKKDLNSQDKRIMEELIQEHVRGRELTGRLVSARKQFAGGKKEALEIIVDTMKELAEFYPKHIEKEDKVFFKAAMGYLRREEQVEMLKEEYNFDREFIHRMYEDIVKQAENPNSGR